MNGLTATEDYRVRAIGGPAIGCGLAIIFASSALLGQSGGLSRPAIHVTDYAVSIDLPDSGSSINGDATLTVQRTGAVDTLTLDFLKLSVSRVTINDRATKFVRTDSTIEIPIPRGSGPSFKVRVVYAGTVTDGLIAHKDSAGRWTYFGDNWPNRARYWIPSMDRPSEKATISWTVTAAAGQTIVANGSLIESRVLPMAQRRRVLSRWRESRPITPYLMVIAAAPLVRLDLGETACGLGELQRCVPQSVYVAPEQNKILPGAFSRAGDIVQFYASKVGPFPYEKLAHLQSETRYGGMENATAIFYADGLFRHGGVNEGLIAHETAHQWFGDAVTERLWPHVWLSEGFATYFAALWLQHAHGDSAFRAEMERSRSYILNDTTAVVRRPVIDTVETVLVALLNNNSYAKGGFVLHMLRSELGDSAFFAGIRDYYTKHKHGTALTADLQVALEHASGKNLQAFFDQWLRRPGYPEVSVSLETVAPPGKSALTVAQTGRFGYFEFPLTVVLVDRGGAQHRYRIPVAPRAAT
ncbi:MAG TPA: M1 family metallopeptidase, partial [Gemmatimonadaceae bacterium]|nr:M1 family metallopeptidase [Gemmatimonadaceae bacterium]